MYVKTKNDAPGVWDDHFLKKTRVLKVTDFDK